MMDSATQSAIAAATNIDENTVGQFAKLRLIGVPNTLEDIRTIINDFKYSTDQEKAAARRVWATISMKDIANADTFDKLEEAMSRFDENNEEVMFAAVEKSVSLHKTRKQIGDLAYTVKNWRNQIKRGRFYDLIFPAYLAFLKDLPTALAVYDDFANTAYESNLLDLTRALIRKMPRNPATATVLYSLYDNMYKAHPCASDVYLKLVTCPHTSDKLRTLLTKVGQELEAAEKPLSCPSSADEARRKAKVAHLRKVDIDLKETIDKVYVKELAKVYKYEALLNAFEKAVDLHSKKSGRLIIRRFGKHWAKKLRAKRISFDETLALLKMVNRAHKAAGKSMGYLKKAWVKARLLAQTLAQAETLINEMAWTAYLVPAVIHWLTLEPSLGSLIKMYEDKSILREIAELQAAILEKMHTFEDGLTLLKVSWYEKSTALVMISKASSLISKITEGLGALGQIGYRDHRDVVLEATLKHVVDLNELKLVADILKAGGSYVKEAEERLLFAKAMELLSQEANGGGSDDS